MYQKFKIPHSSWTVAGFYTAASLNVYNTPADAASVKTPLWSCTISPHTSITDHVDFGHFRLFRFVIFNFSSPKNSNRLSDSPTNMKPNANCNLSSDMGTYWSSSDNFSTYFPW